MHTGQVGFAAIFKHFSGFKFFLLPSRVHALVESMLALHKSLASAKTPQEIESVQRQVESTDGGIDKLVYELYGLTEEEIAIVEQR